MPLDAYPFVPDLADNLLALAAYEPFPVRRASLAALARHARDGHGDGFFREADNYVALTEHATTQDTGVAALRALVMTGLYRALRDVAASPVGRDLSARAGNYAAVLAQRGGERFPVDTATAAERLVASLKGDCKP